MFDIVDLGAFEQTVYEALVDGCDGTPGQLRFRTGLQPPQLNRAIEILQARGLVYRVADTAERYAAVAPDIGMDVLILEHEERLKRLRAYSEQLASRYQRANSRRTSTDLVELVSGREAIVQRSKQIQNSARHQFRAIDRAPYTMVPGDLPNVVEQAQMARGVRYRVLYDAAGLVERHELRGDMESGIEHGEEARVLSRAPIKVMIADDRIGMIPLESKQSEMVSMVIVHESGLLEALGALFESLWERALPLSLLAADISPGEDQRPTRDERRVLATLLSGMTDEAAAKQLGISLRTYHRRVHDLTRRLACETRFQIGVQATRLGWIDTPTSAIAPPGVDKAVTSPPST